MGKATEQQMMQRCSQPRLMTVGSEVQLFGKIPVIISRKSFIIKNQSRIFDPGRIRDNDCIGFVVYKKPSVDFL